MNDELVLVLGQRAVEGFVPFLRQVLPDVDVTVLSHQVSVRGALESS